MVAAIAVLACTALVVAAWIAAALGRVPHGTKDPLAGPATMRDVLDAELRSSAFVGERLEAELENERAATGRIIDRAAEKIADRVDHVESVMLPRLERELAEKEEDLAAVAAAVRRIDGQVEQMSLAVAGAKLQGARATAEARAMKLLEQPLSEAQARKPSRRLAILRMPVDFFADFLLGRARVSSRVPEDARAIAFSVDFERGGDLVVILESDSFEETPPGCQLPELMDVDVTWIGPAEETATDAPSPRVAFSHVEVIDHGPAPIDEVDPETLALHRRDSKRPAHVIALFAGAESVSAEVASAGVESRYADGAGEKVQLSATLDARFARDEDARAFADFAAREKPDRATLDLVVPLDGLVSKTQVRRDRAVELRADRVVICLTAGTILIEEVAAEASR